MLRADIFSMLSVCHSFKISDSFKMARIIRKGLVAMLQKTQDISSADEIIPFFKGWQKQLIIDKCKRNQAMDV